MDMAANVLKAHRLSYHSTLGLKVINKKRRLQRWKVCTPVCFIFGRAARAAGFKGGGVAGRGFKPQGGRRFGALFVIGAAARGAAALQSTRPFETVRTGYG